MNKRKVVKWVPLKEVSDKEVAIGGAGGFFNAGMIHEDVDKMGMRWNDYLKYLSEEEKPYAEAIRSKVITDSLRIDGMGHQHGGYTPLFDDGTIGFFSLRSWGDIMAAIWSDEEDKNYSYMEFYMNV